MGPMTSGAAGCCARAASGHAAAVKPSSVMNSRLSHVWMAPAWQEIIWRAA